MRAMNCIYSQFNIDELFIQFDFEATVSFLIQLEVCLPCSSLLCLHGVAYSLVRFLLICPVLLPFYLLNCELFVFHIVHTIYFESIYHDINFRKEIQKNVYDRWPIHELLLQKAETHTHTHAQTNTTKTHFSRLVFFSGKQYFRFLFFIVLNNHEYISMLKHTKGKLDNSNKNKTISILREENARNLSICKYIFHNNWNAWAKMLQCSLPTCCRFSIAARSERECRNGPGCRHTHTQSA